MRNVYVTLQSYLSVIRVPLCVCVSVCCVGVRVSGWMSVCGGGCPCVQVGVRVCGWVFMCVGGCPCVGVRVCG